MTTDLSLAAQPPIEDVRNATQIVRGLLFPMADGGLPLHPDLREALVAVERLISGAVIKMSASPTMGGPITARDKALAAFGAAVGQVFTASRVVDQRDLGDEDEPTEAELADRAASQADAGYDAARDAGFHG